MVLLLLLSIARLGKSQGPDSLVLDSLQQLSDTATSDTVRLEALARWAKLIAPFDNAGNEALHLSIIDTCNLRLQGEVSLRDSIFYAKRRAEAKGGLGVNYYLLANFPQALSYLYEAENEFGQLGMINRQGFSNVVIGAIFKNQGDFESAMTYHSKALELQQHANDKSGMALTYNNLGTTSLEQLHIEKAEEYFLKALKLYEELGDQRGRSVIFINLGSLNQNRGNLEKAQEFFQQSLNIRKSINDRQGQIFSFARLGNVQLLRNDKASALENGLASLALAEEKGYPRGIRDACELLSKVYKKQRNYAEALSYHERFMAAKDSIADQENIRAVTKAEFNYKFEYERIQDSLKDAAAEQAFEAELALKESENRRQEQNSRLLWVLLIVITLSGGFAFSRYRKARKQQHIIANQKEELEHSLLELERRDGEKALLLKEIHHRVKNNLQVISSLLDLQTLNLEDELAISAVADGQNRVKAMALIHEKLYQNEDLAHLVFGEYLEQLVVQIAAIFPNGHSVDRHIQAPGISLDIDTAIPLGLILCELITNVFKYASSEGKAVLDISVATLEPGKNQLVLRDNGPGLPVDFDFHKAKSLGLRLVRRLSTQLYGNTHYHFDEGAVFTVTFLDTFRRKEVA